jgi:hypothetical protein
MVKNKDDLKGFEELFEDEAKMNRPLQKTTKTTGLEHLNFVQNDKKRLEKVVELFDYKLAQKINFEQMNTYLEKQKEENRLHREELFRIVKLKDSNFMETMSKVFDFHFKDLSK